MPPPQWRLFPTTTQTIWATKPYPAGPVTKNPEHCRRRRDECYTYAQIQEPKSSNTNWRRKFGTLSVDRLVNKDEAEVLEFLAQRPIHTVAMMSLIHDNGIVSPLNRGTFYGCRDLNGRLEGVALVGHATLIETVSDRALAALAQVAQQCANTHMIMGEKERVADFWGHYAAPDASNAYACREWLFELSWPIEAREPVQGLGAPPRRGGFSDAGSGTTRLCRKWYQPVTGRSAGLSPSVACDALNKAVPGWSIENGKLIFKADVISRTAEVNYLEGIWICEERRANGSGLRLMSDLMRRLLEETKSVCLLGQRNQQARAELLPQVRFSLPRHLRNHLSPKRSSAKLNTLFPRSALIKVAHVLTVD